MTDRGAIAGLRQPAVGKSTNAGWRKRTTIVAM
jgi:hypothetical protein